MLGQPAKTGGLIQLLRPALAADKVSDPTVLLKYNTWTLRRILYDKRMQAGGGRSCFLSSVLGPVLTQEAAIVRSGVDA